MGKEAVLRRRCGRRGVQREPRKREVECRGKAEIWWRSEPDGEGFRQEVVREEVFMGVLGVVNEGTLTDGGGRAESSTRLGAVRRRRDGY